MGGDAEGGRGNLNNKNVKNRKMMLRKLRILLNIVLCRIGIRDILPAEAIRRVHVIENNDPMIDISADKLFFYYTNLHSPIYVRNEVYYRLKRAANHLPKGVFLKSNGSGFNTRS